jgi:hypothetical protein
MISSKVVLDVFSLALDRATINDFHTSDPIAVGGM